MTGKERLKQIEGKVKKLNLVGDCEGNGVVNVNTLYNDMIWLIEQAERADRYKEALEEIAYHHQYPGVEVNWEEEYDKLKCISFEVLEGNNDA